MIKQKSYFHLILFVLLTIGSTVFFKYKKKKTHLTNKKDNPVRKLVASNSHVYHTPLKTDVLQIRTWKSHRIYPGQNLNPRTLQYAA